MSRANQFQTKHPETSLQGFPAGEAVYTLDVAELDSVHDFCIHDEFTIGAVRVSCQIVASALVGTLDGTVDLIQSNDGQNWILSNSQIDLDSATKNGLVESNGFSSKFVGVRITKGQITTGSLKLVFICKGQ